MAKKRRTTRRPGRKEALAVIILAMFVGLARQMLAPSYDLSNIPDYDGTSAYAVIDRNQPSFTEEEYTTDSYEYYSELDSLGRCGTAYANICRELMPTEPRGEIGSVKPTGWQCSTNMILWTTGTSITAVTSSAFSLPVKTPTKKISSPAPGI